MRSAIRRGAAVLATALLLLLTGCTVSGTIEVRTAEEVVVDLTFRNDALTDYHCDAQFVRGFSLDVEILDDERGQLCHVTGSVHPEKLRPYLGVAHAGESLVVSFNPLALAPGSASPGGSPFSSINTLDVALRFPGRVLRSTGVADGNVVHFRDPRQIAEPYGLSAEALDHPGPPWAISGPLAGFAAGVVATGVWLVIRKRRSARGGTPAGEPDGAGQATEEPQPAGAGDPGTRLPDAAAAGRGSPAGPGPGPGPGPGTPATATHPPSAPRPRPRPDDSVWAPPPEP